MLESLKDTAKGNVLQKLIDMMDDDIKEKIKNKKGKGTTSVSMTIIAAPKGHKNMDEIRKRLMGARED